MGRKAANTVAANDLAIRKMATTPVDKQTEYKVDGETGLYVVVQPTGTATYNVRYQIKGAGDQWRWKRQTIGKWGTEAGTITFKQARERARELVTKASALRNAAPDESPTDTTTLRELFDEFARGDRKRSARTLSDYREHLERDIFGELGDTAAAELTPKTIATVLRKVKARSPDAAHKCRAALGSLFKWAVSEMVVENNPVAGLGFVHKNAAREVKATPDQIAAMWRAVDDVEMTDRMRLLIRVAMLTGQRNSEVAGARKSELVLGVENPVWKISKERMKRKSQGQIVFLSDQAAALLEEAIALSGHRDFVFPGTTHGRKLRKGEDRETHLTQESVSRAFAKVRDKAGCPEINLHDWRKFMVTYLGERGERPDVLDLMLHHGSQNVTRTHYNHATMERFARPAWQAWADYVEACSNSSGNQLDTILEFTGA